MIIGICGQAGSGKDTAADFLVKDHGFAKLSFADPMKRFCQEIFDFTDEQLWGPSSARNAPDLRYPRKFGDGEISADERMVPVATEYLTPRYALQKLGTEWGRDCYEPIWVEYALRMAKNLDGLPGRMYTAQRGLRATMGPALAGVAIPDCRFRNEILAVRNAGGKVIRIVRPGAGLQGAASTHKSETEMNELPDDLFDVILENTGTLERLRQQVSAALTYCSGR